MKPFIYITVLTVIMSTSLLAQAHHTQKGFRNPYPGFEDRGLSDIFKWAVVDRIRGKKPGHPNRYHFPSVENDGAYLRKNKTEFTVTWVGHSTLLIQLDGVNILTDPVWSERASPVQFAGPKRFTPPGLAFDDLPEIDVVLISHDHYDHLDKGTIKKLGNKPLYFVPLGVGKLLRGWGIDHVIELDWKDANKFNSIEFICLPAQHFSGRSLNDRNKRLWCSWLIKGKERKIYFGGDSGYFPGFAEIGEKYGPIDFAALPIGAFRPIWFMGPVHMSPKQALQAMRDLKADTFIPIHWGTFDLADDLLDEPPRLLRKEIAKQKLNPDKFWLLKFGETRKEALQANEDSSKEVIDR